jgi:hypothetical protein
MAVTTLKQKRIGKMLNKIVIFHNEKRTPLVYTGVSNYNINPEDGYVRVEEGEVIHFFNWEVIEQIKVCPDGTD